MESMFAIYDGEFLFGLFPYEEDAKAVASDYRLKYGNSNMIVQHVSIPTFEFPARDNGKDAKREAAIARAQKEV